MAFLRVIALTALTAGIVTSTLLVITLIVKTYLSYKRLQHIPGPWYVGVTPLWLAYHTLKCDVYLAMEATIREYGSIVRIAPNIIVNQDPELYRVIMAPRSPFIRGQWFEGMKLDPRIDNIVSMTDEKAHAELRTKLMPGYTGKDVTTLESDIDSQILVLKDVIKREFIEKNKSIDFAILTSYFTLDVLSKIAFGSIFGFLKNNCDMFDYHKTTGAFFPIMELGSNVQTVQRMLESRIVQTLAGPKPSDKVGLGAIMGKAHAIVAERYGPDAKQGQDDMLASFVKHGLTQTECESESIIQIMAGSDSTATALRVTFWHIVCNPPVYMKLQQEIKTAMESGSVSHPVISDAQAKALPYLQACIREGLRIFMPLNGLSTRVCPPEGFTWKGLHIPGGTQIGMSAYSMNRRTDIFGPDADTFRPERFIKGPIENIRNMEKVQELCFGFGKTSCLGKGIALMEVGKVLFELFRSYDFSVVNPLNAVQTRSSGVVQQREMYVRAIAREDD